MSDHTSHSYTPPAMLPPGFLVLGKYKVLDATRIYPWCSVYTAEDIIVRRAVQLTLLDPQSISTEAQARFSAATEKLRTVRHPGLVRVFALLHGDSPALLGAASDLPDSTHALADAIEQQPAPWAFDDIKPWLLPALDALGALHQADIILGNLSPWTLLQASTTKDAPKPGSARVMISDLARLRLAAPKLPIDEASPEQQVNPLEARALAPEWLADPTRVCAASDLYSMGVLLHRLLAGRYPFHAEHQTGLLLSHLGEEPPRAALQKVASEALTAIVLKTLAADPAQRFASTTELARALQNPNDLGASLRSDPPPTPAPIIWRAALQRFDTLLAGKITGSTRRLDPSQALRPIPDTGDISAIHTLPNDTIQDLPVLPHAQAAPLNTLDAIPTHHAPPRPVPPTLQSPPPAPFVSASSTPEKQQPAPARPALSLSALALLFFLTAAGIGLTFWLTPKLGEDAKLSMSQAEGEAAKLMATMPARTVDMVLIPSGPALLGIAPGLLPWRPQLTPQQPVLLDAFFIMRHEVSVASYARCVQAKRCAPVSASPSQKPSPDDTSAEARHLAMPVVNVTWHQAKQYCEFIQMRLPTEAEWEKAARGLASRLYPWGQHPDCRFAHIRANLCPAPSEPLPSDAPTLDISPYGVMHMGGNVWEWTADWYAIPQPLTTSPLPTLRDPAGPAQGPGRVIKGSDWASPPRASAERHWNLPDEFSPRGGFRCAVTWAPNSQPPINRNIWGLTSSTNLQLPRVLLGEHPIYEFHPPTLQTSYRYKK